MSPEATGHAGTDCSNQKLRGSKYAAAADKSAPAPEISHQVETFSHPGTNSLCAAHVQGEARAIQSRAGAFCVRAGLIQQATWSNQSRDRLLGRMAVPNRFMAQRRQQPTGPEPSSAEPVCWRDLSVPSDRSVRPNASGTDRLC